MNLHVGIDLGGTSAKVAAVNARHKIVRETTVATSGSVNPKELARKLAAACSQVLGSKRPKHIGVGVAGDIDFERGVVRISPNLGWKNVPLKALLEKNAKCTVVVDNDANVAAWGVYKTQAPKKVKNIIVITLGTGVGGGLIIDGKMHRGATGSAGEIGHMIMVQNGRPCNCGLFGCLEAYAGGSYITQYVKNELGRGQQSSLQSIYKSDPDQITARVISEAAVKGDAFSRSVWHNVGEMLGVACGNLVYTLNPEMIFLCGGVAQARALLLDPLHNNLMARPFQTPVRAVKVKIADNASHIGVIGASLL
jgi:glucokinase